MYYIKIIFINGREIFIDLPDASSQETADKVFETFVNCWTEGSSLYHINRTIIRFDQVIYASLEHRKLV